jgi:hypothetical protein
MKLEGIPSFSFGQFQLGSLGLLLLLFRLPRRSWFFEVEEKQPLHPDHNAIIGLLFGLTLGSLLEAGFEVKKQLDIDHMYIYIYIF